VKLTRRQWRMVAARAQSLARAGAVIEAIQLLRAATQCGLKEAYDAVQKLKMLPWVKI